MGTSPPSLGQLAAHLVGQKFIGLLVTGAECSRGIFFIGKMELVGYSGKSAKASTTVDAYVFKSID